MGPSRAKTVVAMASAITLVLAGCGGNEQGGEGDGTAREGGTLRLVGQDGVDHLDTAAAYYTASYTLERAFARQLVTYPADRDFDRANEVVADVASEVPSKDNGGISEDGRTYTFKLREGVRWNTDPARDVTAHDFVRGLQRLCNPVAPVGAPGYYTTTIEGFSQYCDGLTAVAPTAADIRAYIESHDISGVSAPDDRTLRIKLVRPASDFLNIMAMPFASAAPVEYLEHVPDSASFRQNTISNGPYQITTFEADQRILLERNPAWDKASDPVREAHVDSIEVRLGINAESVQQQLETGAADMQWDTPVPTTRIPALRDDPRLGIHESGSTNPFMVINHLSPNAGGATQKLKVRQALNYAVNKVAIGQVYGGPDLNTPLDQVLTPPIDGYEQFDLYPTPDDRGDPDQARRLLAEAGYPDGLSLKMIYRTQGNHPAVAQTVQADLAKAGITVELIPVPPADFYSTHLDDPASAKRGVWDIATPGWVPDWNGNAARTFFVPLFYGKTYGPGSTNYGGYQDAETDACIDRALAEKDADEAAKVWSECDRMVMQDAAFVPFQNQKVVTFHSDRVENFLYSPFSQSGDVTHVWLNR